MSRAPASFLSFERGLRDDEMAAARRALEKLGIEQPAPSEKRGPGRRKKVSSGPAEPLPTIGIHHDLAEQIDQVAAALDLSRLPVARLILAAGVEAVVRELETAGKLVIPLRLEVGQEGKGYYYQHVRSVTPERFETLRHWSAGRLDKWKAWRNAGDQTGTLMPPPKAKTLTLQPR